MAGQVLRQKMGGDSPWTNSLPTTIQPSPGPVGRRTLQSGGLVDAQPTAFVRIAYVRIAPLSRIFVYVYDKNFWCTYPDGIRHPS